MKVVVMFSGGKDSAYTVKYCLDKGYEIVKLISVKPHNTEAYIYHYPTVEHTPLQAEAMGKDHVLISCNVTGPKEEAALLRSIFDEIDADAVVLGGVGLQETQIREISKIAEEFGLETLVPHASLTSEQLIEKQLSAGMEIVVADVAAGGLGKEWIGRKLDRESIEELKTLSRKNGFDVSGEGGAYNTFVTDAPWFKSKIELEDVEIKWDEATRSGYLEAEARTAKKLVV